MVNFTWHYKKFQLNSKYLSKLKTFARRLPVVFEIDFTLVKSWYWTVSRNFLKTLFLHQYQKVS